MVLSPIEAMLLPPCPLGCNRPFQGDGLPSCHPHALLQRPAFGHLIHHHPDDSRGGGDTHTMHAHHVHGHVCFRSPHFIGMFLERSLAERAEHNQTDCSQGSFGLFDVP